MSRFDFANVGIHERLDDPTVNTTVPVWTHEVYQQKDLEGFCYYWFDRDGLSNFLQCRHIQNLLESVMSPYPIQEHETVENRWGYQLSWAKTKDGVLTFPLRNSILEMTALNREIWLMGEQVPYKDFSR